MKNPLELRSSEENDFWVGYQNENDFPVETTNEKPVSTEDDFPVKKISRAEQAEYASVIFMFGLLALVCGGLILGVVGMTLYFTYMWVMAAPLIAIPVLTLVAGGGGAAWIFAGMDLKKQAKKRHEKQ